LELIYIYIKEHKYAIIIKYMFLYLDITEIIWTYTLYMTLTITDCSK